MDNYYTWEEAAKRLTTRLKQQNAGIKASPIANMKRLARLKTNTVLPLKTPETK